MSGDRQAYIAELEAHEAELVLERFGHDEAWELGSLIRATAAAAGHGVTIDVRRPSSILFRSALPGATPDQEEWVRRKAAVVFRFEASSALMAERLADIDPSAMGWLDRAAYALAGGSVPIRVAGAGVVAAVTVSGLASAEDHQLAVDALRVLIARR